MRKFEDETLRGLENPQKQDALMESSKQHMMRSFKETGHLDETDIKNMLFDLISERRPFVLTF